MLKNRYLLSLVLVIALFASMSVLAQDNARTIEYSQVVESELTQEEPEQFFSFTGSAGDLIEISMTSTDFDTYIFLFDSAGEELESNDDGGDGVNSRLIGFELPADDTYTIRATSFGYRDSEADRIAIGAFTLTLNTIDIVPIAVNDSVTASIDTEGNATLYFSLTASDGDVLDIVVDSGNTLDTRLLLLSPFGFQIADNNDADGTVDPGLFAFPLTTTGDYLLIIEPENSSAELAGDVTVSISEAELASLDTGPVAVELGGDIEQQVFTFEGVAGEIITLTMDVEFRTDFASPSIEVTQGEDTIAAARSLQGVTNVSVTFEVPESGAVNVNVSSFSDLQASVSIKRVEE